jgi:5-methylcytosine-specific restriction endonuclease McrA
MSEDPVPQLIASAVDSVIAGDLPAAELALQSIDRAELAAARKRAMDLVSAPEARRKYPAVQTVPARRTNVATLVVTRAFERDHFTCRYCGRRTIHVDVLKLLSRALPRILPYDPGWKPVEDLIVFWTHCASIEHHVPLARGGGNDSQNIVTSCYQCNDVKSYYLAEELGWSLRPVEKSQWDGLTSRLPALRAKVDAIQPLVWRSPATDESVLLSGTAGGKATHRVSGHDSAIRQEHRARARSCGRSIFGAVRAWIPHPSTTTRQELQAAVPSRVVR